MLDWPEDVCPGQVWFEYPATSVPFSKAAVRHLRPSRCDLLHHIVKRVLLGGRCAASSAADDPGTRVARYPQSAAARTCAVPTRRLHSPACPEGRRGRQW
jgi:hypothetical protein